MNGPHVIYFADPMCSWCWGFAPVLEELERRFRMPIRVMVGGLRPGGEPLNDRMKEYLAHHWEQVEARSGQPFNHGLFTWEDWIYDTELPAIAVVSMRELNEKRVLDFFTRLQRAFYADNVDITHVDSYPELVEEFGVDTEKFMTLLSSEEMRERAWADFAEARRLGVNGFPTVLLAEGEQTYIVTRGWTPAEPLVEGLAKWLEDRYADTADGLVCNVDEPC